MKKKGIQIAFAITLVIISIVGSFWRSELLGNIIYAVVIPSFLLSIISFVSEIAEKCESSAGKVSELKEKKATLSERLLYAGKKDYDNGISDVPYVEGFVPKDFTDRQQRIIDYYSDATAYKGVQILFLKCQRICQNVSVAGYVLLFLSLILSPYAVKVLSVIDMNCITLWSLTLLYFTLELKGDICSLLVASLHKRYLKKNKKEIAKQEQEA